MHMCESSLDSRYVFPPLSHTREVFLLLPMLDVVI